MKLPWLFKCIAPGVLALGMLGGTGAGIAGAQNNPTPRTYEDLPNHREGTTTEYRGGGSGWGWLGLLGLFGLLGARRTETGKYETRGTTYEPRPSH